MGSSEAPGRASSAGLAGRTRCGDARGTNAAFSAGPRQKQSPAEPAASSVRPARRGAALRQVRSHGGLSFVEGAGEARGGCGSCLGGRTVAAATSVSRGRRRLTLGRLSCDPQSALPDGISVSPGFSPFSETA